MSHDGRSDDLLIRARRNVLLEGEERQLRELLATSPEDRLLFDAGSAFDREAPVLSGDEARIERMLRAVRRRRVRPRAPVPGRRVWQALATGVLIGGAAMAAIDGAHAVLHTRAPVMQNATVPSNPALLSRSAQSVSFVAPGVVASAEGMLVPVAVPSFILPVAPAPSARVAIKSALADAPAVRVSEGEGVNVEPSASLAPAVTADVPSGSLAFPAVSAEPAAHVSTAGELFAAANRARMQGVSASAIAAYRRLESEFPSSVEAVSARLSLGIVYLQSGQASLALEQFRAYAAQARGPTLGEALWGESQALHQLGDRAEERRVLSQLLAGFPDSAYAEAARKRLSEP